MRKQHQIQVAIGVVLALTAIMLAGGAQAMSPLLRDIEDAFVRLHEEVRPCVVNINTKGSAEEEDGAAPEQYEDLFRFFGMPQPHGGQGMPMPRQMRMSTGSGFIYDKEGHIITNNHVVQGAAEITVKLWDGKEYTAKLVGADPDTDLAVIKIEATEDLPVAKLGDSSKLKVGQFAVAMGSPRGLEGSLSYGHISALGRENLDDLRRQGLRFQNLIQTDAAINLGNSGGPLTNVEGEVIGINVAIVYGANSLGFAIPVNTAKDVIPQLVSSGKITRGYLGVGIDDVKNYAEAVGLDDNKGAFVKEVKQGTPADKAKMRTYDVIRKINGEPIENAGDLIRRISGYAPGTTVKLEIWREKQVQEVDVTLDEWQGNAVAEAISDKDVFGMKLQNITPDIAQKLGLKDGEEGALVTGVEPGSPSEDAGIIPGDVLKEIGQTPVKNVEEVRKAVGEKAEPGKSLLVGYLRKGRMNDITVIKIPKE